MKKTFSIILLFSMLVSAVLTAAETLVCAPQTYGDWQGFKPKLACKDGLFDTGKALFVLFSKKNIAVTPGKTYRLTGDFKLKPYAPFGNILFGFMFFTKDHKEINPRAYIGASPYDYSVCPGNNARVRNYWLTFQGRLPEGTFKIPANAAYMKILLHQRDDHVVDMIFKNIKAYEEN